ncbi:hypothetical protein AM228_27145 [Planktothricoides sp. SR001]|nr:hypothetical protein AM228_27145 [Planktothricoides sp. SR001]
MTVFLGFLRAFLSALIGSSWHQPLKLPMTNLYYSIYQIFLKIDRQKNPECHLGSTRGQAIAPLYRFLAVNQGNSKDMV